MTTSLAFKRLATVTANIKRAAVSGAGVSSGFANHLIGIQCLPLMSVDPEVRNRPELQAFHEVKETYIGQGFDIDEGDRLVIDQTEYPIRAVEEIPWRNRETYLRLIVEELKT